MTKPVMTLRNVKAAALTHSEHDQNFINLRDATISLVAGTGGTSVISDLNGSITLVAGTNITLSGDNTAKTITINAANESQNIFQNIAVAGQDTIVADSTSDTLTLVAGSNITLTTDAATDTITFAAADQLQNIFQNIAVAGQTTVSADTTSDTLTLVAGTNITLTTDAATDSITINNTAPGGLAFGTINVPTQGSYVADSTSDTVTIMAGRTGGDQESGIFMGMRITTVSGVNGGVAIGHRSSSFAVINRVGGTVGTFTPNFDPFGGSAIQRVQVTSNPLASVDPYNISLQTPTNMIAGDRMTLIIINNSTTRNLTVIIAGSYKIALNSRQKYFEENSPGSGTQLAANGGNMVFNILYDGTDYWTEINTDYTV
jgi:hypothetical protein